jgi:hypothetical protein
MRLLELASGDFPESFTVARRILAAVAAQRVADLLEGVGNKRLALEALHTLQMPAANTLRAVSKALADPDDFSSRGTVHGLNKDAPFGPQAADRLLERLEDEGIRLQAGVALVLVDSRVFQAARLPPPFLLEIGASIHAQVGDFAGAVEW